MEIEQKVLLLGIYKKEDDESIQDVLIKLEDTGMFNLKEAKRLLKVSKEEGYFEGEALTFTGVAKAKEIESEFKL